jgi:hypothetical protein
VAVTDFPTKAAVIVRDDLAVWQRLNVPGFLVSGLIGSAEASAAKLQTVRRRAAERGVPIAIYTAELFSTGHDDANREAVRAVPTDDLDLVGIGVRAAHEDTDAILRGLRRHD